MGLSYRWFLAIIDLALLNARMKFQHLSIEGWRQFENISLEFHPRLTVIAGANGAGKSTILRLLAQHFGLQSRLIATPMISRQGVWRYLSGLFGLARRNQNPAQTQIGQLTYDNRGSSQLSVQAEGSAVYDVIFQNLQQVQGLFVGSHRPSSSYQPVSSIPTDAVTAEQAYQRYHQEIINKYNNTYTQYSPTYRIKEAIISMATFGPGNRNVQGNPILETTFEDFKAMLSKVLPETIGFVDISIRIPDVVIVTRTGEFMLDAASGGLMAIIDLAWQIFLYSRDKTSFVTIIDEPENHLHPSMQRSLIGSLIDSFPGAQFIVATHSPFVVSSVRDSAVYVLRFSDTKQEGGPERTVYSEKLGHSTKAGTASEVLRDVLGVPVTLPLWAENEIESIAADFRIDELDQTTIGRLRSRLENAGLGEYYAEALGRVVAGK